jgi:hypothetical protein
MGVGENVFGLLTAGFRVLRSPIKPLLLLWHVRTCVTTYAGIELQEFILFSGSKTGNVPT